LGDKRGMMEVTKKKVREEEEEEEGGGEALKRLDF
jgi:hypothetical protein